MTDTPSLLRNARHNELFFSVITVTRNNLSGLRRTCSSLKSQTCRDFEWIVIDGASEDSTPVFLATTSAQWISEPDTGLYDAMNKGIDRAQGTYVLFLNAGDMLAFPDTLAQLRHTIPADTSFVYGDALESFTDHLPQMKKARHAAWHTGMITHHQAMLYRRSDIQTLRYNTTYTIAADYDFTLRFLRNNPAIFYLSFPLCLFESGGISQKKSRLGRTEQYTIRKNLKCVGPLRNYTIQYLQYFFWCLRQFFPALYWRLKS